MIMPSTPIRCALITRDEGLRTTFGQMLGEGASHLELVANLGASMGELTTGIVEKLEAREPDLVVVDVGDGVATDPDALALVRELTATRGLVVTGPEASSSQLLELMRAGVSEYLPKPVDDGSLRAAIRRQSQQPSQKVDANRKAGELHAVYAAKGGSGVTTTAVNVAVQMARVSDKKILLVDLTSELGTAAVTMGLEPRYSFLDVIQNAHRMDWDLLESHLERHESGVYFLGAPILPGEVQGLGREDVKDLLRLLRGHFDVVVVDLGKVSSANDLAVIEAADHALLVTTPELPTLKNTRALLTRFATSTAVDTERTRLVLNAYWPECEVSVGQVEEALGIDVFATLRRDGNGVPHSINLGLPIVLNGKSPFSQDVKALGSRLAGAEPGNGRRGLGGVLKSLVPFRSSKSSDRRPAAKEA